MPKNQSWVPPLPLVITRILAAGVQQRILPWCLARAERAACESWQSPSWHPLPLRSPKGEGVGGWGGPSGLPSLAMLLAEGRIPEQGAAEAAEGWDSRNKLCMEEGGEAGPTACAALVWPCSPFQCPLCPSRCHHGTAQLGETISCAGDHLLKRPTGYPEHQYANRQSSVKHLQPSLDLLLAFCSVLLLKSRHV